MSTYFCGQSGWASVRKKPEEHAYKGSERKYPKSKLENKDRNIFPYVEAANE